MWESKCEYAFLNIVGVVYRFHDEDRAERRGWGLRLTLLHMCGTAALDVCRKKTNVQSVPFMTKMCHYRSKIADVKN